MFSLTTILFLGCNGESKITDTGETKLDADGDGVFADIDCDDSNPNVSSLETFYQDADGDGFGDENTSKELCGEEEGMVREGGDCDDTNPDANDTTNDQDCDAIETEVDCDDTDSNLGLQELDLDCDGVLNEEDEDIDGDGTIGAEDCNDLDNTSTLIS